MKAQVDSMRATQRRTAALYDFSRKIAPLSEPDDVLYADAFHIAATLDCRSLILMPDETRALQQVQGYPTIEEELDARSVGAARWAIEKKESAGAGTPTLPAFPWLFVPLATAKPLGVQFRDPGRSLDPETKRLLLAVKDQVAVAVERTRLCTAIATAQAWSIPGSDPSLKIGKSACRPLILPRAPSSAGSIVATARL